MVIYAFLIDSLFFDAFESKKRNGLFSTLWRKKSQINAPLTMSGARNPVSTAINPYPRGCLFIITVWDTFRGIVLKALNLENQKSHHQRFMRWVRSLKICSWGRLHASLNHTVFQNSLNSTFIVVGCPGCSSDEMEKERWGRNAFEGRRIYE